MEVIPYKAEHMDRLDLQEAQRYLAVYLDTALRKSLEGDFSFTVMDGDEVLCCAGLVAQWENRGLVWAYISETIGPGRFTVMHRHMMRLLDSMPFDRIEASVDVDFEKGHRWVRALGFTLEAPLMRRYRPDGGDSALYARVR